MSEALTDPNMRYAPPVPAAIRKIAADAEALQVATYKPAAAPASEPPAAAPAATTVVATERQPGQPTNPTGNPPAPASAPAQAPATDWEQKYRSLEGRFNIQVQELRAARENAAHIPQLQAQIADLRVKLEAATRAPSPTPAPATLDPKDVETWGEDLLSAARRSARAELQPEVEALRRQIEQLTQTTKTQQQQVQATTVEQNRRNVDAQLPTLVGADWNDTNNDPGFLAWLQERDIISGAVRMPMLINAYNSGDATRVAAIFNTWRSQHTERTSTGAAPAQTPTGAGTIPLETFAAPGAGRAAPTSNGAAPTDVYVTQKEITQFYSDVAKDKYRNNPAGKARREAEIFAAIAGGRVTN